MSAPYFPTEEQILEILFAELPDGVYPTDRADDDDPDKRSYSSSELRSKSRLIAELYEQLDLVYQDKFASTVTEAGISQWEKDFFRESQDGSQPFETRKQNLIAKIRASGGISLPAIKSIVDGILTPKGLLFEVLPWNGVPVSGASAGWFLDETPLDSGTYLSFLDPLIGAGRDPGVTALDCALDYAAAGLTLMQLEDIQRTAYTYEVRIYGVADASTLAQLEKVLTEQEPARSTHVIINDAQSAVDANTFDLGSFGGVLLDSFDAGLFSDPPATYNVFDMGGFL